MHELPAEETTHEQENLSGFLSDKYGNHKDNIISNILSRAKHLTFGGRADVLT
jgi:hypothetical protein